MEIKHGTARMVILLPSLGIVIKFAKCNLRKSFDCVKDLFFLRIVGSENIVKRRIFLFCSNFKLNFLKMSSSETGALPFFWSFLFQGLYDNLIEFLFYLFNPRQKFLVPTYFSFFGIFNIQPLQENICKRDIYLDFEKVVEENDLLKNAHTFDCRHDFAFSESGNLRAIDYAGKGARKIIKQYGSKLYLISNYE